MLCQLLPEVQEAGRCSTRRRTEDCTQTPSFNEVFAQGADGGGSEGSARGAQTQLLVEHLGGGGQKIAQLIREEAAAPAHSLPRPCILTLEGPASLIRRPNSPPPAPAPAQALAGARRRQRRR
jgi:hypothetical protein